MGDGLWRTRCRWVAVAGSVLASGCYQGLSDGDPAEQDDPERDDAGDESGADDGDAPDDGADDGDGGDDPSPSCDAPDAGPTRLQRLTRTEYDNTIRALLDIEADASSILPDDGRVGPFESNDGSIVAEYTVEQYRGLAETIAATAVQDIAALVPCEADALGSSACADAFVDEFVTRAYRRPLSDDDRERYATLFSSADGTFDDGIRLIIEAALQSTHFLYRVEVGTPGPDEELLALTGYEVASRLSYFLWKSMPDDVLIDAAATGDLDTADGVQDQALRMLEDERADAMFVAFHEQWLGLEHLETTEKDGDAFPLFADARESMLEETRHFVVDVIREGDGRLETLLTATHTFVDDDLAAIYGVDAPGAGPDTMVRVELDPSQRAGLFTQPAMLAVHSHIDQTSPVQRGRAIRNRVLCGTLPPPPPEVDDTPPAIDPTKPVRQRYPMATEASCKACHEQMDLIGFGLEHYDPIGAWRTQDGEHEVDASGELIGTGVDGPFSGAPELAARLAQSDAVRSCVARQWSRFALGRAETPADACAYQTSYERFADSDYDIRELVTAIVTTNSFRYKRLATEEAGQ